MKNPLFFPRFGPRNSKWSWVHHKVEQPPAYKWCFQERRVPIFTCVRCGAMVPVWETLSTLKGCLKWGPQAHPPARALGTATIEGSAGSSGSARRGFPQGGKPSQPPGVYTPHTTLTPHTHRCWGVRVGVDVRDSLGDGAGQGIGSLSFDQRCSGIFLSRPGHRAGIWETAHEWSFCSTWSISHELI